MSQALVELEARKFSILLEPALKDLFSSADPQCAALQSAVSYSFHAEGKRIRPYLCFVSCESVGGEISKALPGAISIEMIHAYSLIHDDLPAMDDDDLRRGKPSNHKVFGEGQSILAGDALLTEAFAQLALANNIPAIQSLARGAGYEGMVGGQSLDLLGSMNTVGLEINLERIHRLKTGKLMRSACEIGGLLGNGQEEHIQALGDFGESLGLAFQIQDDILDATSTPEVLGKQSQKDTAKGKLTYVSLWGLSGAQEKLEVLTRQAIQSSRSLPNPYALRAWAEHLLKRNK